MTVGGQNPGITGIWKLGSREAFEQCCKMKPAALKAFCQAAVAWSFAPLKPFQPKGCSVRKEARSLQRQMLAFKSLCSSSGAAFSQKAYAGFESVAVGDSGWVSTFMFISPFWSMALEKGDGAMVRARCVPYTAIYQQD